MEGYIDGINFAELEAMKYYAPPNSWSPEKKRETARSRIFSGDWWGARKVDGAFYKFLKDEDGNMTLTGRSKSVRGIYLDKIDWVPHLHKFFEELPNGTCLLGELYLPRDEQAKTTTSIMNCLKEKGIQRQQKEEDKLHYYIFDILAYDGKSYMEMTAENRFDELIYCWRSYGESYWEWAKYVNGKELWNLLQQLLADGYEGVVINRGGALYQPGKRPSRDCLKVKKELQDTIDCVIIGANPPTKVYLGKEIETWEYWFNEVTNEKVKGQLYKEFFDGAPITAVTKNWFYGWAGSLRLGVFKGDKMVEIGNLSGITDEIKENWQDYVGKVCEITAMEIMDNDKGGKGLRHPKFVQFRDDIDPKDCTWEKVFGQEAKMGLRITILIMFALLMIVIESENVKKLQKGIK